MPYLPEKFLYSGRHARQASPLANLTAGFIA
jgi:hypothetical protein